MCIDIKNGNVSVANMKHASRAQSYILCDYKASLLTELVSESSTGPTRDHGHIVPVLDSLAIIFLVHCIVQPTQLDDRCLLIKQLAGSREPPRNRFLIVFSPRILLLYRINLAPVQSFRCLRCLRLISTTYPHPIKKKRQRRPLIRVQCN